MPFANQYVPYIQSEFVAVKNRLKTRNFYKIISYEYADGHKATFSGPKAALIFLVGITPDLKLQCIKISEVRPAKFFAWFKKLIKPSITCEQIKDFYSKQKFEKILIEDTKKGSGVFSKLKTDSVYNQVPYSFRTYSLDGIKQIKTIYLSEEWLKNTLLQMKCYEPEDLNKDGIVTDEERKIYAQQQNVAKEEKFRLS